MRVIKRYANRRLYDSESSKTITLDDIASLIKSQEEFQVIDNATNEDITNKILAQTFLKINLNGVDDTLNQYLLSTLIRESSDNMQQFLQKMILSGIGLANQTREYIEQILKKIIPENQDLESAAHESNILSDLTHYVSEQANSLAVQVQNGIKSLGLNWPNTEDCSQLQEEIKNLQQALQEKELEIDKLNALQAENKSPLSE